MGCVLREYDHICADDCPVCCTGTVKMGTWTVELDDLAALRERALRAEAEARDLRETVGELLGLVGDSSEEAAAS